jgi:S1/P1 Nuclease
VTAIKKDFEVLSSSGASQAQKLASLRFLGHGVGDIHQPLHVSFEDDRGGNSVLVTGICGTNLHSAWAGKVTIDATYVVANTPIVKEQLQKAGVRLAHLLDAALGKQ